MDPTANLEIVKESFVQKHEVCDSLFFTQLRTNLFKRIFISAMLGAIAKQLFLQIKPIQVPKNNKTVDFLKRCSNNCYLCRSNK